MCLARLQVDGEEEEKEEERIFWCYQEIILFGDGLDRLEGDSNPELANQDVLDDLGVVDRICTAQMYR